MAVIANKTSRHERARNLLEENLPFVRARGQTRCEATTLSGLAETSLYLGRPDDGVEAAFSAARMALEIRDHPLALFSLETLAAAIATDDPRAATLLGGTEAARQRLDLAPDPEEAAVIALAVQRLGPDSATYRHAWSAGAALDLQDLLEVASAIAADRHASLVA